MATLSSSPEKFQTSTTPVLLVPLQGLAVSVCGSPRGPHSTFMLLEDQGSHRKAKQAQPLSTPKEGRGLAKGLEEQKRLSARRVNKLCVSP